MYSVLKTCCKKITVGFLLLMPPSQLLAQAVVTPTVNIGQPAPSLKVAKWLKGKPVEGFEKGKLYVVEFWATWCKPCIAGMPHLSELARQYRKDVTVLGVSILERKDTPLSAIEKFVGGMGDKMDYTVGVEEGDLMAQHWLKAAGERGIPFSFVIDRQGRVAWLGHPKKLDKILPQVISGTWDIAAAAQKRKELKRLSALDNKAITLLNPFMGNPGNPKGALQKIDSILAEEPLLRYYPAVGHFTFYSLVKTDPEKAANYGKAWIAASDEPRFSTITDAVTGKNDLIPALYLLAAESYQAQLDLYPWSMNFPDTYKKMADLYARAGNPQKSEEMLRKAEEALSQNDKTSGKN